MGGVTTGSDRLVSELQREDSNDQTLLLFFFFFLMMYFRTPRRTRPALTYVVMVTALMEAACDFREPIVTDVFHREELLGFFFVFPKSNEIRK